MTLINPVRFTSKYRFVSGDRLFEPINHFLIIVSAIAHAASLMVGGRTHTIERPVFRIETRWPDCAFLIPLRGPLEMALTDRVPDSIEIGLITDPEEAARPLTDIKHQTMGFELVYSQVISPVYLAYFERYNDWLTQTYGDAVNWPPTLNFARVVRNAVAHGRINIRNPGAQPVTWRDLTYGYQDNGRKLIGTDLRIGEMLALMFDSNEALDALNAPVL